MIQLDLKNVILVGHSMSGAIVVEAALTNPTRVIGVVGGSAAKARVIEDFVNADSLTAVEILEQNEQYPTDAKLKSLNKTLYLINSNYHPTDTLGFQKQNVLYRILSVGPTGHYPMIENPDEFNRQLETAIMDIGKIKPNS